MDKEKKNYQRNWKHEIYTARANLFSNGSLFDNDTKMFCKDV